MSPRNAVWLALGAVLLLAASARSEPARPHPGSELRTREDLVRCVQSLAPWGTVLAAVVVDTGKDPVFRPGTFFPTRSVTVTDAAVLRVQDGTLTAEPLPGRATVLYPSSLWSGDAPAGARPSPAEARLIAAQRVGDMWVAFPESPAWKVSRKLLARDLDAATR